MWAVRALSFELTISIYANTFLDTGAHFSISALNMCAQKEERKTKKTLFRSVTSYKLHLFSKFGSFHMLLDLNAFKSIKIKLNLYRASSHSLLSQLSSLPADRQSGELVSKALILKHCTWRGLFNWAHGLESIFSMNILMLEFVSGPFLVSMKQDPSLTVSRCLKRISIYLGPVHTALFLYQTEPCRVRSN